MRTKMPKETNPKESRVGIKTTPKGICKALKIPYNFYNNFIIYSGYKLSQLGFFREN